MRRRFAIAGMWDADRKCLPCGRCGCQAEHALYETADGRQGMGARQMNEVWAIIPACPKCNTGGDKLLNQYCALMIGDARGALSPAQQTFLSALKDAYEDADYDPVRRRIGEWVRQLEWAGDV